MWDQAENKRIPILMYHSISEYATSKYRPFAVSPALFAAHMAYLHQQAYTPLTITQLVTALATGCTLPERPVILTFDDGFVDFFTEALPILQQYSFTATLYVVTGFVNGASGWLQREGEAKRSLLSWQQIREISAAGVECGGHSHSHRQLDTLSLAEVYEDISLCKSLLEDQLGREILSFAYPYGYHSPALKQQVRSLGFTSACAVKYEMSSLASDPFALPRLLVRHDTSVEALDRLLTAPLPSTSPALQSYKRTRAYLWRVARRYSTPVRHYLQGGMQL